MDYLDSLIDFTTENCNINEVSLSVPRLKKFAKEHPGVIKNLRSITSKDNLDDYINKIKSKEKFTEKEIKYLTDLWQAANRNHDIWRDLKVAGIMGASGAIYGGLKGGGIGAAAGGLVWGIGGGLFSATDQILDKRAYKRHLTMAEVSLFIEDFRNLYNSALDLIYEYNNEEMPIEKVITYNEAAYILNEILN